ncbi:MAG: thiolase family protein [Syntrophales bacterium]|nr:thiolase family protein [Syntrophales bacterium]
MRKINYCDEDIVIVSAVRTPFSKFDTAMKDIPSLDLAMIVMKEVIRRVGVKPEEVEEINYGGCIFAEMALEGDVPARQAALLAGFPAELISNTMDRACCSSMTTMRLSIYKARVGELKVGISVGAENMPRTPHLAPGFRWMPKIGYFPPLRDHLFEMGYKAKGFNALTVDAGEVALEYGVTRAMQDAWALQSQERYFAADAAGRFDEELTPVVVPNAKGDIVINKDESPRKTSMEALAKLGTVYGSPTVTAGNAPPLSAGATAVLFMTRSEAEKRGLKPIATVIDIAASATAAREIAVVPAITIQNVLDRNGLTIDDMKLIEINEAFAAMPLVATKILAKGDEKKWKELQEKTNVNGGAIAIGHPVGASGGRIMMHLARELERRGGGYGVAAICGGLAQGEAVILKV